MRKTISILLAILLVNALAFKGCAASGDKKTEAARFVADSCSALIAWSDATQKLSELGDIEKATAKAQFEINEKLRLALGQIRDKVHSGFIGPDTLTRIQELTTEIDAAQELGLLGIKSAEAKIRFREITAFAKFSIQSIKNILQALQPPALPAPSMVSQKASKAAAPFEKWTPFILIAQDFLVAVIRHHRLSEADAFNDATVIDKALAETNKIRLAA